MERMRRFALALALAIAGLPLSSGMAHAEPSKIIISFIGWQSSGSDVETELRATGWVESSDEYIDFPYMYDSGTELEAAQEALPRLEAMVNDRCFKGIPCELHGISRGSDVLVWIENQEGWPKAGLDIYLHESAAGDTGAMHSQFINNPNWQFIVQPINHALGDPNTAVPYPTAGTQLYYNNASVVSNLTPQCGNVAAAVIMLAKFKIVHSILMPKDGPHRYWRAADGSDNYETGVGYASGADVKSCPPQ